MGKVIGFYDNEAINEAIRAMLYDLFSTAQDSEAYKDALYQVAEVIADHNLKENELDRLLKPILQFGRISMILGFQFVLKDTED